jgi:hypothetical protein
MPKWYGLQGLIIIIMHALQQAISQPKEQQHSAHTTAAVGYPNKCIAANNPLS